MYCQNCGNQVPDGASFCSVCGAQLRQNPPNTTGQFQKKPGKRSDFPLLLFNLLGGGAFVLLALAVTAFLGLYSIGKEGEKGRETKSVKAAETTETGEAASSEESGGQNEGDAPDTGRLSDSELAKTIERYCSRDENAAAIDIYAENYMPGPRNPEAYWDRTLFYTLEDVNPNSADDGRINGYSITRKMLRNAADGNKMEYEIYTNPVNGRVNKIVSIEYFPNYLEITDYYFDDAGRVSFIFVRNDINYVPSYAVPTKDGQRFYFHNDSMVKWRVVSGGIQTNNVIGQRAADEGSDTPESVRLYSRMDAASSANYDAAEKRMLNAAYNTYNTVLTAEGISEITGYIYNEDGEALPEVNVILIEAGTGEKLYGIKTNGNGEYRFLVPSGMGNYRMEAAAEGYVPVVVYGIAIDDQMLSDYQPAIYMVREGSGRYPVNIQLYDALNYAVSGSGMERLSYADLCIRRGINNRTGQILAQATADMEGMIRLDLEPGMYTAEVSKSGYDNTYYNFVVKELMGQVQISASPSLASGEVRIVLTWGQYPWDLDSHLFTPYDSAFGDTTYHIWYGNQSDRVGNNLDVDDTDSYGPETMTIPELKNGLYKYYVADFTNCSGGMPGSYDLSLSGARVDVYTSNGLTASFPVPVNVPGVIWEVFEIRNGVIVPIQRYYSNIDDKTWWHNDK